MDQEKDKKKDVNKLSPEELLDKEKEIEEARRQGKSEAWIRMNLDV